MLRWRLILGTVIVAALLGLCWLDHAASTPGIFLLPVGLALVVFATCELLDMLAVGGMKPRKGIVYAGNLALFASCWQPQLFSFFRLPPLPAVETTIALFAVLLLVVFLGEMLRYEKPGGIIANIAASVFALAYVGLMFYFIAQLRMTWGVGAMVSMIVVVKMGDIGAYTIGRLFGRHKMAPRLSPGKTIEGAAGALAFALLGSWLSFVYLLPATRLSPLPPQSGIFGWVTYGLLLGIAGMFGDLAESLIKRDVGRKDSSNWMPGFGGVLDILDSLLLAAPVAWFCWAAGILQ